MVILYSGRLNPEDFNLPTDYISAASTWGDLFYKAYTTELEYEDAKAQCESDGTFLAVPRSQTQNDFFADLLTLNWDENLWIGINDIEEEGSFVAVDGRELSWTNWNPSQPNGGGDGVIVGQRNGRWYDTGVMNNHVFVCSIDIEGIIFPFELYRPCLSQQRPGFKFSFSKVILRRYKKSRNHHGDTRHN